MPTVWDLFGVFYSATIQVLILVVLPICILSCIAFLSLSFSPELLQYRATAASFSAFGTVIGLFIGVNHEPLLTSALPALIAIVTVYITYLTEKDADPIKRKSYAFSLLGFFLGTGFGVFYGTASATALRRTVTAFTWQADLFLT
jgi:hypothetical protein